MSLLSHNEVTGPSKRKRLFAVLILILLIVVYSGWQFARRYQIESEVLGPCGIGLACQVRELLRARASIGWPAGEALITDAGVRARRGRHTSYEPEADGILSSLK
jgi:hypothetical protein